MEDIDVRHLQGEEAKDTQQATDTRKTQGGPSPAALPTPGVTRVCGDTREAWRACGEVC